jgi:hypothetical protein
VPVTVSRPDSLSLLASACSSSALLTSYVMQRLDQWEWPTGSRQDDRTLYPPIPVKWRGARLPRLPLTYVRSCGRRLGEEAMVRRLQAACRLPLVVANPAFEPIEVESFGGRDPCKVVTVASSHPAGSQVD